MKTLAQQAAIPFLPVTATLSLSIPRARSHPCLPRSCVAGQATAASCTSQAVAPLAPAPYAGQAITLPVPSRTAAPLLAPDRCGSAPFLRQPDHHAPCARPPRRCFTSLRGRRSGRRLAAARSSSPTRRGRQLVVWWVTVRVPVTHTGGGGFLDPRRVVGRVTGVFFLSPGFPPVAIS
jgi:hypothetical protein